jgi:hypothetical protein
VSATQPAAELLETPGALLTRSHLRELGLGRAAVDAEQAKDAADRRPGEQSETPAPASRSRRRGQGAPRSSSPPARPAPPSRPRTHVRSCLGRPGLARQRGQRRSSRHALPRQERHRDPRQVRHQPAEANARSTRAPPRTLCGSTRAIPSAPALRTHARPDEVAEALIRLRSKRVAGEAEVGVFGGKRCRVAENLRGDVGRRQAGAEAGGDA